MEVRLGIQAFRIYESERMKYDHYNMQMRLLTYLNNDVLCALLESLRLFRFAVQPVRSSPYRFRRTSIAFVHQVLNHSFLIFAQIGFVSKDKEG